MLEFIEIAVRLLVDKPDEVNVNIKILQYIKMDFNPMMAPPPMAPAPVKKGGNTTLYIVIFFLCVISVMAGAFYFQTQSAASKAEAELKRIQADALKEVNEAFDFAETQPWPKPEDALEEVYVNYPRELLI